MRAFTVVSLFLCACTSGSDRRSDIRYSSHPDTGECVATDPAAGMDGTWEECEPDCMAAGMCADVCPALDCGDDGTTDPSGGTMGGSDGTDPSGMTGGSIACPDGNVIGPDGCPTCECYHPPCDDPPPPPPCDPATGMDCCPSGMDPTAGMGCCFADGSCCDPSSTMGCPPPTCDPAAGTACCDDGSMPNPDGTCGPTDPPTCDPMAGTACCDDGSMPNPDGTCCDPSSGMGCP